MKYNKVIITMIVIVGAVVVTGFVTGRSLNATADKLEKSIVLVEEGTNSSDWPKAQHGLSTIEKDWDKAEKLWTMLIDHIEIDNIDTSLRRMSKYIESKDKALALAELANLRQYIKHIPEKESFKLKNIL